MFNQERPREDDHELSDLEAALAALVPRAERLNRDRLMFLAGQASVAAKVSSSAVAPRYRASAAWPAALATMTAIATLLLVALVMRSGPQLIDRSSGPVAVAPPTRRQLPPTTTPDRVDPGPTDRSLDAIPALPNWLAWTELPLATAGAPHDPSYPEFRNQVLLRGIEPWAARAPQSAAADHAHEQPVLSREQLNRWLEHNGEKSAGQGFSAPSSRNPLGVRS